MWQIAIALYQQIDTDTFAPLADAGVTIRSVSVIPDGLGPFHRVVLSNNVTLDIFGENLVIDRLSGQFVPQSGTVTGMTLLLPVAGIGPRLAGSLGFAEPMALTDVLSAAFVNKLRAVPLQITDDGYGSYSDGSAGSILRGGRGDDDITTFGGPDRIIAGAGQDTIHSGSDTILTADSRPWRGVIDGGLGSDLLVIHRSALGEYANFSQTLVRDVETVALLIRAQVNIRADGPAGGLLAADWTMGANSVLRVEMGARSSLDLRTLNVTSAASTARLVVSAGNGGVAITGARGIANDLSGGAGNDYLGGGSRNDTLLGGIGTDSLFGGAGNDEFFLPYDRVNTSPRGIIAGGTGFDGLHILTPGKMSSDLTHLRITGIEALELSSFSTVTFAGSQVGEGGLASDLRLFVGRDVRIIVIPDLDGVADISGFRVRSNSAYDLASVMVIMHGIDGRNDVFASANLRSELYGEGGNDRLSGGARSDLLDGGAGADRMAGGRGSDVFHVDNIGDIVIEFADGGDTDTIRTSVDFTLPSFVEFGQVVSSLNISLWGNSLNNVLIGNGKANLLAGNAGNDRISGGSGADTLFGGAGADSLAGSSGNDSLVAGDGHDSLLGEAGNDVLRAGAGDDLLYGGIGSDSFFGGNGNDTLEGVFGQDVLFGGEGADVFKFSTFGEQAIIADFVDGDRIDLRDNPWIGSFAELKSEYLTTRNGNAQIVFEGLVVIVLMGVDSKSLSATDFLF
jgi:Ca2+-binding RTX toxin-like protein